MKKLILTLALTLATLIASANEIRYFTRPQAMRVATALDAQNELMIYCGYEYELATYVIINEVWMEPVNSKFFEIWLYGYDAYTGEEIYMPIDLACIWLFNSYNNRIYSAAQMLRFRSTVGMPNFYWTMPPYNSFTRRYHDPMFNRMYTYHYEVHRYGWRPPHPPHGGPAPLPSYYMRTPSTPAYVPTRPYTPGVDYPRTADGHGYLGSGRNYTGTRNTGFNNNGGTRSGDNHSNSGNPGTTNRNSNSNATTNTGSTTNGRGNATTNTGSTTNGRGSATTNTGNTNGRGSATTNTGNTNGRGSATTNTGNTNGRGSATTNTGSSTNGRGTTTNTPSSSNSRGTATTNKTTTTNNRATTTTTTTTTTSRRGNATTNTGSTSGRSTATTTNNKSNTNNRGTSTTSGRNGKTNSGSTSTR